MKTEASEVISAPSDAQATRREGDSLALPRGLPADEIRTVFLSFFEQRGHRLVRSSPLVPQNDPTLLFANAGMNQFKDVFLGREKRAYVRAASSQKCVRAGGKHNDLENVGLTARHHTFFEMLGNFSFGDYFKEEAIAFGWEFLTRSLGLPADRLKVTIFHGTDTVPRDAEAHRFWTSHVSPDRILELGMADNFWAMGETGPCGPCSEIHFHQGDSIPCPSELAGGACAGVECECDRWLEIWNLVFMQYDRTSAGELVPLPAPCVDTGMGLERLAAVVQGHLTNYDTDLFRPLIEAIARHAGVARGRSEEDDVSLRVIADHLRAMTFLVADGVLPGNEGRGYVLRKIMRRAMRHGKRLGLEAPFLHVLTSSVVLRMEAAYPELRAQEAGIARIVRVEEERFAITLRQAVSAFDDVIRDLSPGATIGGPEAFRLYDTYGLALDFTEELAREHGLSVDSAGFARELEAQQERARQASRMGSVKGDPLFLDLLERSGRTTFVGHHDLDLDGPRVLAIVQRGAVVSRLATGEEGGVVLDRTPFYAEAGGQVGDQGVLAFEGGLADVRDCTAPVPGLQLHAVSVRSGTLETGATVRASVDAPRRSAIRRHHTATHLLNAALREVLGTHVKQAGSLVAPDRLRFDFSHFTGVTPTELRIIENRVNDEILRNSPVDARLMPREDALTTGALAFFGDKYGEEVRVVDVPGFSRELCGGTHVQRTGDIGVLVLTLEQGISAGTRRIEAVAGEAARRRFQEDEDVLGALEASWNAPRRSLAGELGRFRDQAKELERELRQLRMKAASQSVTGSEADTVLHQGVSIWTPRFDDLDRKAHAALVDEFRNQHKDDDYVALSVAVDDGGVHVIAAVSRDLSLRIRAADLMKRLGLRGGGRPDFAQGGGVAPQEADTLRRSAVATIRDLLAGGAS